MLSSGIVFSIDAREADEHHLHVSIQIDAPFTQQSLKLQFPRWVPGSYFLREPIQHVFDIKVVNENEHPLKFQRKGIDELIISKIKTCNSVHISYKLFCLELSVRSNHLDDSHLHLMPPYTWFLPVKGIDLERLNTHQIVKYTLPSHWTPATQLQLVEEQNVNDHRIWTFEAENRDHFLDSIMEANERDTISRTIDGRVHHFKLWDSGGYEIHDTILNNFLDDCEKIVREYHALFGVHDWGDYLTVLHLTQSARGGLEHLNSQTSMMPRGCLQPGQKELYRDLLSLFSHEYVHQWNVKRLRPKSFHDYDLQSEGHTDLLWWFEGCTSWLGDMQCVRSGAWSEKDWIAEFEKKLKRHFDVNGLEYESLEESSFDAWIHLYRSGPYSRERQISYYLEGELAILCIDAELQRRSKGASNVGMLMKLLCERHALGYPNSDCKGIELSDIISAVQSLEGGKNMGRYIKTIVQQKQQMPLEKAMRYYGRKIIPKVEQKEGLAWLGVALKQSCHSVNISRFLQQSPLRNQLKVKDEIIAVDGLRCTSIKEIEYALQGKADSEVQMLYSSEGVTKQINIILPQQPPTTWTIKGGKNVNWIRYLRSLQ